MQRKDCCGDASGLASAGVQARGEARLLQQNVPSGDRELREIREGERMRARMIRVVAWILQNMLFLQIVVGERGCTTAIEQRGRRLLITRRSGVCFDNIHVLSCKNARADKRSHLARRWLPRHNKQDHGKGEHCV